MQLRGKSWSGERWNLVDRRGSHGEDAELTGMPDAVQELDWKLEHRVADVLASERQRLLWTL